MTPQEHKQALQLYIHNQRRIIEGKDIPNGYKALLNMADLWLGQVCSTCNDTGVVLDKSFNPIGIPTPCQCFRAPRMRHLYEERISKNV